jgi:protein-L-isoaspartate O-methyltransferase
MAPPQPGDPGSTATGQAQVRQLIDGYADRLKANGAIRSPAVEQAFRTVPRHRLLETFFHRPVDAADFTTVHHDPAHPRPEDLELIYADTALGTRLVEHFGARLPASSTSQPSLVADMLELLDVTPGLRVLEVGAGTGYNAALLAELVGDQRVVTSVDVAQDVVAQTRQLLADAGYPAITVLCRDGFDGVAERAPFDRIVATVGCADLSPQWAEQLAEDGRLLVPLAHAGGTRCCCSGGRMAGWGAGWRAGRGSWTRAASSTPTGCGRWGSPNPTTRGRSANGNPGRGSGPTRPIPAPTTRSMSRTSCSISAWWTAGRAGRLVGSP